MNLKDEKSTKEDGDENRNDCDDDLFAIDLT